MNETVNSFMSEVLAIWLSGGWLMLPLALLTFFIYYTATELLLWLNRHFLIRDGLHRLADEELAVFVRTQKTRATELLIEGSVNGLKRHYRLVRREYLPPIDRRIKFLAIIVTAGPLMGLLGTVTGMLATFEGLSLGRGGQFQNVVKGISEALITTQTGLMIALPAMVLLAFVVHRRNILARALARLESYNLKMLQTKGVV